MKPVKKFTFSNKVIFVDGMPGCGKTLFSQLFASYPRVELLNYAYYLEHLCGLHHLEQLTMDAAVAMVHNIIDGKTYHGMMCRETNFRPTDLSSVFRTPQKLKYFKRLFMKGDHAVTQRIYDEDPILNLAVHNLLPYSEPIFEALGNRAYFIEIVRHPLYQIRQHYLNTKDLFVVDPRDVTLTYEYKSGEVVPYFVKGYEEEWIKGNAMDKAILSIYYWDKQINEILETNEKARANTYIIPFEKFVLDPEDYLVAFEKQLNLKRTTTVRKCLKKQKVPRKKIADGVALSVYKRCGWKPPIKGTERDELAIRYEEAKNMASPFTLKLLDEMNKKYEDTYMTGIL